MNLSLRNLFIAFFVVLANGVQAQVTANFTASPTSGCAPLVVTFTNTSTGNISGYSWNFGNSGTSALQNPSTSYTSPGTYTVRLTVSGPGGTNTVIKTAFITVYPPPTANFTFSNPSGCAPLTVQFTSSVTPNATPTGVTYAWDFGDGFNGGNIANPSHTYASGGTFPVTLVVRNSANCSTTVFKNNIITVYPKPTGSFSAFPTTACKLPARVQFSSSASGTGSVNVSWDFGDGSGTSGHNPAHTYTTAGSFTVKMYMTDSRGCKDSIVIPTYINTHSSPASFTGPTSICQSAIYQAPPTSPLLPPWSPTSYHLHGANLPGIFINTTPGATPGNTFWDFGDGTRDTGDTASHPFYVAGTFTVRMITDLGGCLDTTTRSITVHPFPTTGMSFSRPNCPAPTTLQFTATGAVTYQWSWNTGGTATGATPTRSYATDNIVEEVTIIGTDSFGCKDTLVTTDTVFDMHIRYLGLVKGCVPLITTCSVLLKSSPPFGGVYPASITSYHWDFGDGNSSTAASPTHTYVNPGIYKRVLTITTSNGCTKKDTVEIRVGNLVKPSFTINPDTACVKVPIYFTNTTPLPPSSTLTYTWDVGQGHSMVGNRDAIASYFRPGTYNIILYSDSNGCIDSTVCTGCLTILPSNANFTDSMFCAPWNNSARFIDSSIGATSRLWDFGDGNTSTLASPTHAYAGPGTYFVRLTTHNSVYGCRDTMIRPIIFVPVVMDFVTDTTICRGDVMQLTPTYTGPPGRKTYDWYIDDANLRSDTILRPMYYLMESILLNASGITGNVNGRHTITLRVGRASPNGGGYCIDTLRKNNYVIVSRPTPIFGGSPLIGCTPLQVTFRDSSIFTPGTGPGNRYWTFGNGDTASNNNSSTTYTYTTPGIFNVKLKVTDWNGCPDSLTKVGYVDARRPDVDFVANRTNTCAWRAVTFISYGGVNIKYKWDFGDGDTAVGFGPTHYYKAPGSYTVRLIGIDSTGCRDTAIKVAYINITAPTASFTLSDTISVCPPLTVRFASTSTGATSQAWDFGNSGSATIANPVSTYSAPGVYTVRLIAYNAAGCPDTATATVRILGYAGALSYSSPAPGCVPHTVHFTANVSNVPSLMWDFSDGTTRPATGPTTSHTYMTAGSYVPKLIFSDGTGCSSSSIGIDTIRVDDVIAGFKVAPPCEKTNLTITDTSRSFFSAITNSRWDFGGSGVAIGNPVTRSYPVAGTYPVTLISTNATGCKDTLTKNITIHPLPQVIAPPDTAVCVPDAIMLQATGATSYVWSPAAALSCTACPSPMASPGVPTVYVVTGTDNNGCSGKDSVRVGIQTKTTFLASANGEICLGKSYRLYAVGATLYSWTPSESLDYADSSHPTATPKQTTTYIVTAKEGSCLADTHSVKVIVRPLPTIDAGGDLKVVAGNGVLLQASGTGVSRIAWDEDPTLSCFSCYAPEARPKATTTYRITAYNEWGCTATDSVRVVVLCDGSQLYIPNTFSPNGDGVNDFFFPRGQGIDRVNSFRVYSRWGELLFDRANAAVNSEFEGWNGTAGGRKLNPDVYVYVIEATCDSGEPIKFKGDITLMR